MQNRQNIDTFKVVSNLCPTAPVVPTIEFKIDGDADLDDMLEAFESFLKAIGYLIPAGHRLDFVDINLDNKGTSLK